MMASKPCPLFVFDYYETLPCFGSKGEIQRSIEIGTATIFMCKNKVQCINQGLILCCCMNRQRTHQLKNGFAVAFVELPHQRLIIVPNRCRNRLALLQEFFMASLLL